MMIHRHFKFLEECVESGDAKNIVLQYDTNLTNIPQKVMGYWKEFKFVEFHREDIVRSDLVKSYIIERDRLGL